MKKSPFRTLAPSHEIFTTRMVPEGLRSNNSLLLFTLKPFTLTIPIVWHVTRLVPLAIAEIHTDLYVALFQTTPEHSSNRDTEDKKKKSPHESLFRSLTSIAYFTSFLIELCNSFVSALKFLISSFMSPRTSSCDFFTLSMSRSMCGILSIA